MTAQRFTAWSFSRWEAHSGPEGCPLFAKLKFLDKIEEPSSPAMARGNRVHQEIAAYLMNQGAPPPETKNFVALLEQVRLFEDKLVEGKWGFTINWKPTTWFGEGTWFRSITDLAVMYEDYTGLVVDHKTGKRYGVSKEQVRLFGASFLWKYPNTTKVETRLWYLDEPAPNNELIDEVRRDELPAIESDWKRAVAPMFADETFLPRPGRKCGRCYYSKSQTGRCKFG